MIPNITALYKDTRVLVLGASGFIGRSVASRLGQTGAELIMAVRNASTMQNQGSSGEILEIDLQEFDMVTDMIMQASPMIVFNLAGYGIDPVERDEAKASRINADLLPVLVKAMSRFLATRWQGQRIVHTGSALEYGMCAGDLSESSDPVPTTLYGQTKLAGTEALKMESMSMKLASITARLFTVYGPGEHAGRLLPSLLEAARNGKTRRPYGRRSAAGFYLCGRCCRGLLRLGISKHTTRRYRQSRHGPFNKCQTIYRDCCPNHGYSARST